MVYNTEEAILKHIFNDLFPHFMHKYSFTDEEIFAIVEAKRIMLAKVIENKKKEENEA